MNDAGANDSGAVQRPVIEDRADDDYSLPNLIAWLDAKYRRHKELEDLHAADALRCYSTLIAAEAQNERSGAVMSARAHAAARRDVDNTTPGSNPAAHSSQRLIGVVQEGVLTGSRLAFAKRFPQLDADLFLAEQTSAHWLDAMGARHAFAKFDAGYVAGVIQGWRDCERLR